jgi:alkylation response protein AidB-like acyl-CoA dehydrogenase
MNHIYGVDETGQEWVRTAAAIADGFREQAVEVDRAGCFPEAALSELGKQGLLGLAIPEQNGGQGQTPGALAGVVEELAMVCPSTAMIYVMHVSASQAIVGSACLADRDRVLKDITCGQHLTTLAFSERGSRSQFWAPVSRLVGTQQDGFVTSASKSWVTAARHADSYVCSAQQPNAASPLESVLYLADPQAEQVTVSGTFDGLGLRGNDSAPVEISGLPVESGALLTEPGAGTTMMLEVVLPWFAVGTAAMANGICRAAVAATSRHLQDAGFSHDDTRLRDLPNLRARLAEMNCRTEESRALLGHTVQRMLTPDEQTPLYVLQSRMAALNTAVHVTDLAMKACGGAAFSLHLGVEQMFRDARAGWVMAPTVDHLQEFVGRALTGLPLF